MGSSVDGTLDRLARLRVMLVGVLNDARPSPDWSWEILHAWDAMCEEREQLREERDELERDRDSWVDQCEESRRLAAKDAARAESAEAENARLTALLETTREGLRDLIAYDDAVAEWDSIDAMGNAAAKKVASDKAHALLMRSIAAARALLAASSPPPGDTEDEPWESFASSQGGIFNGPHPADSTEGEQG